MVFYVTMVTFLVTLFMNNITNIVIPTRFSVHLKYRLLTQIYYHFASNNFVIKYSHG